jgi:hypothetical protein
LKNQVGAAHLAFGLHQLKQLLVTASERRILIFAHGCGFTRHGPERILNFTRWIGSVDEENIKGAAYIAEIAHATCNAGRAGAQPYRATRADAPTR